MASTKEYMDFIGSVKDRIGSAQYEALKTEKEIREISYKYPSDAEA